MRRTTASRPTNGSFKLDRRAVEFLAYMTWEKEGRPAGRELDYWLECESQLKATLPMLAIEVKEVGGYPVVSVKPKVAAEALSKTAPESLDQSIHRVKRSARKCESSSF